jgi:Transglycosylase SLT domain
MLLALIKSARVVSALRVAATAAACMVLQVSPSHAQMLPPERSGNPNEVLVFEQMRVPRWLAETVVRAAQVTGVDPAYLLALADKESSLLPDSKARTSSAEGLFQFIEGTWLEVLRRYGPKHGYAAEAEAIRVVQGRPVVSDSNDRERILDLRRDPYLSALMAGEMINTHRQILAGKVARDPSFAELYMAHFLGVNGASRFVALLSDTPEKRASEAFPRAAKGNSALFFDKKEATRARAKALSVAEVQGRVGAMIDKRVSRYANVRTNLAPAQVASE